MALGGGWQREECRPPPSHSLAHSLSALPHTHILAHVHPAHPHPPPRAAPAALPTWGRARGAHMQPDPQLSPQCPTEDAGGTGEHPSPPSPSPSLFTLAEALEGNHFFFPFFPFFLNQKKKKIRKKFLLLLLVSPNINGGTCSSDNTLKERYRTHCLQRGNVQARGTRTGGWGGGGGEGTTAHKIYMEEGGGGLPPNTPWRD